MIFGVFNARKSKRDFLKIDRKKSAEFFSDTGALTGRWVEKRRRTEVLTRQKTKNIVKILYTIDSTKKRPGKKRREWKKTSDCAIMIFVKMRFDRPSAAGNLKEGRVA